MPHGPVTVLTVTWFGPDTVDLVYRDAGAVGSRLLFRSDEHSLTLMTEGRPWSFDADGELLRLAAEAQRIRLAHLSDPYLAIHTSEVDPLPHQITAVYAQMLPRQPLRYLLADDPGAGKTIMAGLLIKELKLRGDPQRCLVVCPGNLVEQWQDELFRGFGLRFEILTRERSENALRATPSVRSPCSSPGSTTWRATRNCMTSLLRSTGT
jgi:SNF2 family DNA or RNA helicase